ncbi:NRDE family protein [Christiangramia sabulilitoris]|uniref:NRDE family protein n=1 Tax=Christiangramia sabulilitoris TaxID=2583991 RepID=A0A550HZ81_9FLAO|nr:NRDE family protein [Christiangramia sabulilitoris]TRO64043.1 NRDE family protein [Christiangramia sabulilitoris]
MCTITLVPHPESMNGFILTSNRDEAISRETLPPQKESYKGAKLYFPKDKEAGGTWLGITDLKRCVCLMNGADKPHVRKSEYRKSRGVVVKDFLSTKNLKRSFEEYNLRDIEPFTMIIVDWNNGLVFYELLWDGKNRKITKLPLKEHIWSSSPLYSEEMKGLRRTWFQDLKQSDGLGANALWDFHHHAGEGSKEYDLVIDRGFLKTQSISQVVNSAEDLKFTYENLENKEIEVERFQFNA